MSETITFFGSGPVAAESLKLLAQDFEIEAVITKPKPAHHKAPFPVLALAEELGLKVFTASTKEEMSELFVTKPVKSKIGLIIDHGLIVDQDVIDYFPLGIVNSHFSLLPKWRGADPISFAILNGDRETGVSLMVIVKELDEGALIAQRSVKLSSYITTPMLTEELIKLSYQMLVETLPDYIAGKIQPYPQPSTEPTYSRKLTKEDGVLDWAKTASMLEREIRAYIDWPRSRTKLGAKDIIITKAHVVNESGNIGDLYLENKRLGIYCSEGVLMIDKLIPAGKKEMPVSAFLAGRKLT